MGPDTDHMTTGRAFRDGIARVGRAPLVLVGVYLVTLVAAIPFALIVRGSIASDLGSSLVADEVAANVDLDWWLEFLDDAPGLASTLTPSIVGFAAVLDNLSSFLGNDPRPVALVLAVGFYLLVWTFLSGGVLDRLARNRATRAGGFFSACGGYFFRMVRLALLASAAYYVLFFHLRRWLFDDAYPWLVRDVTIERRGALLYLALLAVFGLALVVVNVVFDYARIRAVVEDRRSMVGALGAGIRFVTRRWGRVALLYGAVAAVYVLVVIVYALVAPGVGGTGSSMWLGFAVAQAYILARVGVKLLFTGAQTAFFQGELAHADYAARPAAEWPDSPAAEAVIGPGPSVP